MKQCWAVYLLLGAVCWGQSEDSPAITIDGLCYPAPGVASTNSCKTVISHAEFERVIDAIQPDMPARARREFALRYANALVMTQKAEQMGLDKGLSYDEQMRLSRIEVLTKELKKAIQEEVSRISSSDIEEYYKSNVERFENAEMERIYVPKTLQPSGNSEASLNGPIKPQEIMKREADGLRTRAVAGEEFARLQAEAYRFAGIGTATPGTGIKIRRTSLPQNQTSVMDLKAGEISAVIEDPNGYVIYRVKSKDVVPLDQAREEIKAILRSKRMQEEMSKIQESATPFLDESYFLPQRAAAKHD